jgi:hypothetical protein
MDDERIQQVQSDVDSNSALIVEIVKSQEAMKGLTGEELAEADKRVKKLQKVLNARLMKLAQWADTVDDLPPTVPTKKIAGVYGSGMSRSGAIVSFIPSTCYRNM